MLENYLSGLLKSKLIEPSKINGLVAQCLSESEFVCGNLPKLKKHYANVSKQNNINGKGRLDQIQAHRMYGSYHGLLGTDVAHLSDLIKAEELALEQVKYKLAILKYVETYGNDGFNPFMHQDLIVTAIEELLNPAKSTAESDATDDPLPKKQKLDDVGILGTALTALKSYTTDPICCYLCGSHGHTSDQCMSATK